MEPVAAHIDQHIQELQQEIASWIAEVWINSRDITHFGHVPGWLIAGCPAHPYHPMVMESIERLQDRFSAANLGIMAADMYFHQDLWWEQYRAEHEQWLHSCSAGPGRRRGSSLPP